jgi:predicted PurR-regulated permease PerM
MPPLVRDVALPLLLTLLLQTSAMPLLLLFSNRILQVVLVWSLLLLLLLPPLVLLLLLFFWQFKEKIKRNCRQTPEAKLAESSSLQAACVCARCSM